jgi:hypothetical protein
MNRMLIIFDLAPIILDFDSIYIELKKKSRHRSFIRLFDEIYWFIGFVFPFYRSFKQV